MKIYTSYFANHRKFGDLVQISICAKPPKGYKGLQYKVLAPTYDTFIGYKYSGDAEEFERSYYANTLSLLDADRVVEDLEMLSGVGDVVLLCYEKSNDVCHRHFAARWIADSLNIHLDEL